MRSDVSTAALIFSCTMRWYSAAEHVPQAIMADRIAMVCIDAVPRPSMTDGSERLFRYFLIHPTWGQTARPAAGTACDHNQFVVRRTVHRLNAAVDRLGWRPVAVKGGGVLAGSRAP